MPISLSPQPEKPSVGSVPKTVPKWLWRLLGILAALLLACVWVLLSAAPAIAA
ncbi:MAG: hypothetical protein MJA27_30090 [Pseudanabaenales cyanobacterium]|nr:hypothetical protein [Pseudanabaenales cyanobacterium]